MNNKETRCEDIIDMLDEMIDQATKIPFSGRVGVDAEDVKGLIMELRMKMPQEIAQARKITKDRAKIIADAKKEGEDIIRRAEQRARLMVDENETIKKAEQRAAEMLSTAQTKSREIVKASKIYGDELLRKTEDSINENLMMMRKARQNLKEAPISSFITPKNTEQQNTEQQPPEQIDIKI